MGFLAPFILGVVAGGVAVWQLGKRQLSSRTGEPQPETGNGENVLAHKPVDLPPDIANASSGVAIDKLSQIRGIGATYAQRLNAAGIQTFEQLAELAPDQVNEIVSQGKGGNLIDGQDWIEQAKQLAKSNRAVA